MPEGGQITRVFDKQGMEAIFASLEGITGDIKEVTASLRKTLGGEQGQASMQKIVENMVSLSSSVDETVRRSGTQLDYILGNVEGISSDLRGVTSRQDQNVERIIENIRVVTEDTRTVLATLKDTLGTKEGEDVRGSIASVKDTLDKLNRTVDNLEQITGKVRDGKGAAGALLTDERIGQKISETVDGAADLVDSITRLQTEVGLRSEYLVNQGSAKNTFSLRLIPKPDKYYLLEAVDDPRGTVETETIQTTPAGTGQPVTQTKVTTRESLKITAQVAKRFYFTTVRFGVTENTGGIGTDFHLFNDALTLKLDAFNFSVQALQYPRLRATARLQLFNHLVVTAGADDILNKEFRDVADNNRLISGRDLFLGAGVYFSDDDLRGIFAVMPSVNF